jgi:Prp8 binding protein
LIYNLEGHSDIVTGLKCSPTGDRLLSTSMDNTGIFESHLVCVWDIKPFSINDSRLEMQLEGAPHGYEKNVIRPCWSPDGDFVACGSGDRSVVVWNLENKNICYKLPGHKGCVNQVDWANSLLVSGSNDHKLYLGELNVDEVK